jgi:hypothetical protein
MKMARPPRGYDQMEYPLHHEFDYKFGLSAEAPTKNCMIATILRGRHDMANAIETIEVNPENSNYAEETGPSCYPDSIIPRISLRIDANMSKGAIETDAIRRIKFRWFPIYTAMETRLDAADERTGTDVEAILELQHNATGKKVYPVFMGTNLNAGFSHPLNTVSDTETFDDYGLTANDVIEGVTFDMDTYFDARKFYSNKGMLEYVCPKIHTETLTRDRGWHYHSNNYTYPTVKRITKYTWCGIGFEIPQADSAQQYFHAGDVTGIDHIDFTVRVGLDQWNNKFDQKP